MTTSIITAFTSSDVANNLALVGSFILFILLFLKELTVASADSRLLKLGQVLEVSLLPFSVAFILVMIIKVMEVLS
jgi:hypothetical protein